VTHKASSISTTKFYTAKVTLKFRKTYSSTLFSRFSSLYWIFAQALMGFPAFLLFVMTFYVIFDE
jgi:hypothetical protein